MRRQVSYVPLPELVQYNAIAPTTDPMLEAVLVYGRRAECSLARQKEKKRKRSAVMNFYDDNDVKTVVESDVDDTLWALWEEQGVCRRVSPFKLPRRVRV